MYFYSCSGQAHGGGGAAMAASTSHWHSYLGVIVSHERQRLGHFQQAKDILLTLLEGVHAREPRFLADYARNLVASEFALCASEDAVTMEVPLWIDGDALGVLACWLGDTQSGTWHFDIVPVVRRQQEPLQLKGRQSDRGFPEGSLRKATEEAHFIPAAPYCWRSSTHLPILKLVQAVDALKGPRLDSLHLLDQFRSQDWREEGGKGGLTFNHLEMVLLWSTELFPSPEDWQDLEGSVYRLLVIFLRCLATRHLPHFLHPEENLFQGEPPDLASLYHKVDSFTQDP
ncbi:hypothetical protein QYF61_010824 [Mycteria americana]|uniref:Mab-21-like HhH/H2TH-like domain-containing protein n=1 Tax=Mycteria americana TaxID=33587 RepID=A0AAN7NPV5_MYCAM|nr:hypothetical protein QYF61_010824 [Mycteria americana]